MYQPGEFLLKLEDGTNRLSERDKIFCRKMFTKIRREERRPYVAEEERYYIRLLTVGWSPHGRRQTLRVRFRFEISDSENTNRRKSDLECIDFTYTFGRYCPVWLEMFSFRRYIVRRVACSGVKLVPI